MKHLCLRCGKFVRWSLAFCWDCNERLRVSGGTRIVNGQHEYPPYQEGHMVLIPE